MHDHIQEGEIRRPRAAPVSRNASKIFIGGVSTIEPKQSNQTKLTEESKAWQTVFPKLLRRNGPQDLLFEACDQSHLAHLILRESKYVSRKKMEKT